MGPVSTSGPAGYRSSSADWTVLKYLLRWFLLAKFLGVGRLGSTGKIIKFLQC